MKSFQSLKNWLKTNSKGEKFLLVLAAFSIAFFILGFFIDFNNVLKYGSIDLRNRIVGARLLSTEYSPYFFKWNKDISDRLLDPMQPTNVKVGFTSVTPDVLFLLSSFSWLDYKYVKIIWFFFQYFFFLYIAVFFFFRAKERWRKYLIIILSLFFIAQSSAWRMYVERGQIYIFYAFLLCLVYQLYSSSFKYKEFFSGALLGFGVFLRPLFVLIFLPFLINRKTKFIYGGIAGFFIGLLIAIALSKVSIWQDYFLAMKSWSEVQLAGIQLSSGDFSPIVEGQSLCDFSRL